MIQDPGSRTTAWLQKRWPAIHARGAARFILLRGVLLWGGVMFIVMSAFSAFKLGVHHPRLPLMIAVAALLCAVGGLVWGVLTWTINERLFRTLNKHRIP